MHFAPLISKSTSGDNRFAHSMKCGGAFELIIEQKEAAAAAAAAATGRGKRKPRAWAACGLRQGRELASRYSLLLVHGRTGPFGAPRGRGEGREEAPKALSAIIQQKHLTILHFAVFVLWRIILVLWFYIIIYYACVFVLCSPCIMERTYNTMYYVIIRT